MTKLPHNITTYLLLFCWVHQCCRLMTLVAQSHGSLVPAGCHGWRQCPAACLGYCLLPSFPRAPRVSKNVLSERDNTAHTLHVCSTSCGPGRQTWSVNHMQNCIVTFPHIHQKIGLICRKWYNSIVTRLEC